jgi:lipoprotein-anchoring transpeptidase ErfK/SrfK
MHDRRSPQAVPPEMLVRLDGRVENRLGARLYKFGGNTLFRIHGTNERNMIGPAASPGCIGTLNSDVRAVMP